MRLPRLTKPYKLRDYKFSLVLLVFALSVIGVMVVGSAKASVQNKQIFGVCVGFILMMIVSLIDYIWILNFYWIIYAVAILSLSSDTQPTAQSVGLTWDLQLFSHQN